MKPLLCIVLMIAAQLPAAAQNILRSIKGSVHGKVLHPDGRGVSGATVELAKQRYGMAQPSVIPTGEPTKTDANGDYRFEVSAGEYYVRTRASNADQNWHTYFPGTIDPGQSKMLRVTQGADISADIQLSEIPAFKVSVRITDVVPVRGARHVAAFYLTDRKSSVQEVEWVPAGCTCPPSGPSPPRTPFVTIAADRFEVRGVRPGSYELRALMWIGDTNPYEFRLYRPGESIPVIPTYEGRTILEVSGADAAATVEFRRDVPLNRVDVKGRATSNGKSVSKDTVLVQLIDASGNSPGYLADLVDSSGRFAISGVPEGRYQFSITTWTDAYVEDIRQGGVSILDAGLVVGKAPSAALEVFVNPVGGVIDGLVENGSSVAIALIATTGWNDGRSINVTQTNPSGEFKMRGIPPGEYRILALRDLSLYGIESNAIWSPNFTGRYASQSIPVTVKPGVPTTLRITSIAP